MKKKVEQVLTVAGIDSGGGAGIQADLKTFQMRKVFGTNIVVALTAQNTLGVQNSMGVPLDFIQDQFESIRQDFDIKAVKTGMLMDKAHVQVVAEELKKSHFGPLVVDPVMIAKGGHPLLSDDAIEAIQKDLLPLATLLTPNIPEAERLVGQSFDTPEAIKVGAKKLQDLGVKNVIIKGGHGGGNFSTDYVLLEDGQDFSLREPRVNTENTHGTGDTYSAAITAELAKGADLKEAIITARKYLQNTIAQGIEVGNGHGPLNHWAGDEADIEIID